MQKNLPIAAVLLALVAPRAAISQNIWTPTNGIYGGFIGAIAHDSIGNTFIGCDVGIYKSTDKGASWTEKDLGIPIINGNPATIRSLETDLEGNIFTIIADSNQLFKSTDNGSNWKKLYLSSYVNTVLINKKNILFIGTDSGVIRSSNGGENWIDTGLKNRNVGYLGSAYNDYLFALTDTGIFRSTDEGSSWHLVDTLIGQGIACSPNGFIYVAVNGTRSFFSPGISRSTDNGNTWTEVSNGLPQKYTVEYISLGIDNKGYIYTSTYSDTIVGIFRTSDNGNNWSQISSPKEHILCQAIVPSSGGEVYIASDRGVLISSNHGNDWVMANNGITDAGVTSISIDSSGNMYAATGYGGGVFISTDDGLNWTLANKGLIDTGHASSRFKSCLAAPTGQVFVGSDSGEIFRSNSDGSWNLMNAGLISGPVVTMAASSNKTLFAGSNNFFDDTNSIGIKKSTDNGLTWKKSMDGLTGGERLVNVLAINFNGNIFAGTFLGISRSIDDGVTWSSLSNFLPYPGGSISSIAVNSKGKIFACAGGYSKIYKSSNNGNSWITLNTSQIPGEFNTIATNAEDHIFLTTSPNSFDSLGGVYRSTNNGLTWNAFSSGLKDYDVSTIVVDKNGYAFAGSRTGVYKTTSSTLTSRVLENTKPFEFIENYPNPFKPSTTIRFSLSSEEHVTLKVFDFCGRELATLLNEHKNSGIYEIPFDGSELPAGIYEYRLQAGNLNQTGKMTLLK